MGKSDYRIADEFWKRTPGKVDVPQTIPEFEQWVKQNLYSYERYRRDESSEPKIGGDRWKPHSGVNWLLYVASTIEYDDERRSFLQGGSGPNYHGDVWTLSCCLHQERQKNLLSDMFRECEDGKFWYPTRPLLVVTCASSDQEKEHPSGYERRRNWVASVAFVTHAFRNPENIYKFLQRKGYERAKNYRQSAVENAPKVARNQGDLHVDANGELSIIPQEHQHSDETIDNVPDDKDRTELSPADFKDNHYSHLKFLSQPQFWVTWREPKFAGVRPKIGQSPISGEKIQQLTSRLLEL